MICTKKIKNGAGFQMLMMLLWGVCVALVCFSSAAARADDAGQGIHPFTLPAYEKIQLKNGLTVYLMEHHSVPLIYVTAVFPAGAAKDGAKSGLAYLTADSLFSGAGHFSKKQIEERLEFLGAKFSVYVDLDSAGMSGSFIHTDQDLVFPVLKEVIQTPVFPLDELAKRKKRLLLELRQDKEQPAVVLHSYFRKFIFGNHGYGNPLYGTPDAVKKITRADVKAFYSAHYRPESAALVIVGDFQTAQMKKRVQDFFETWPVGKTATSARQAPVMPDKSRVLLVNKSDAAETRFIIGAPGMPLNHPDYIAVKVVNTVFGGRFTSWLNDALRVSAGLTYGAGSSFNAYKDSGTFTIGSFTRTDHTTEAIDLALGVLNRLHAEGVDEASLASAKYYLIGQFPTLYETPGSLAGFLKSMFVYGVDESFVNDFQKNVENVTVWETKKIIAKHFPQDALQFVLIGKAAAIRGQVKKYGELSEKEIKDNGF
jgi:predicted Zn-dependent peptidase